METNQMRLAGRGLRRQEDDKIGNSIFTGGDKDVKLAGLEERAGGQRYELQEMIDWSKWFDVPKPPPKKKTVSPGTTLKAEVVVV